MILFSVGLGLFMVVIDITILNIAMPTLAGSMSALLLGLIKGPSWGWFSFSVDLLILGGLGILSLFIVHELRTRFPLVDLSLFRIREFAAARMAGLFATLAFASLFFLLPFYWQGLRGYSAQETGLLLLPVPLILMIVAPLSGRASDRLGSRGLATSRDVVDHDGTSYGLSAYGNHVY